MMKIFYFLTASLLVCANVGWEGEASAEPGERLKVVATLTSFADIAEAIGGERVEVSAIASPRFNPHFIEPKPSDVLRVKKADLYLHSGLDLQPCNGPLVNAAARADLRKGGERQLDLSQGINLLEVPKAQLSRAEGDIHLFGNPHYWLDPRNGMTIAKTIAAKLIEIDPAGRETYEANLDQFLANLSGKITEWQKMVLPLKDAKLVGYHNEWVYLMNFTGLKMEKFLEPKPGIPPSPGQIASVVDYVKNENVKAIIQPSFYPDDAAREVSERTGAKVIKAAQNVRETEQVNDYVALIDYDIKQIVGTLK